MASEEKILNIFWKFIRRAAKATNQIQRFGQNSYES